MEFIPTNHPIENEYPKLVRDNILDIIKDRTGQTPEHHIAEDDREFLDYLLKKIVEEATELQRSVENDNTIEELADVYELLDVIAKTVHKTHEEIAAIQKEKRQKNGGFDKRIIMHSKVEKPS